MHTIGPGDAILIIEDGDGIWIGSTVLPVTFLGPFVTWTTTNCPTRKLF